MYDIKYINKNNKNIKNILLNNIYIHHNLYKINNNYKNEINNIPIDKWKIIRSISNNYEIIGNNRIHQNDKLKNYNIISRAYYKLLEILNIFESTLKIKEKKNMEISCLCEAPGGFIQCLYDYRENKKDNYKTISKKDDKYNKIDWKISIENLEIIYGEKEEDDGNLYNPEIIKYYINKHKKKVDLVTADGGLLLNGYEENYKSNYHIKLYLCELYVALKILKNDGIFILKIYEMSQKIMIDFLILLNELFINVKIIKPKTSRDMNNEKYIICYNKKMNTRYHEEKILKIINTLWENKDLLLINLLKEDYINKNVLLLNILKNIEYNNLIKQNQKLKNAIMMKNLSKDDLKYKLKNIKNIHYKYAYNWLTINNLIK